MVGVYAGDTGIINVCHRYRLFRNNWHTGGTFMVKLILPYPPTLNSLYRAGGGKYWMTQKGKDYKTEVATIIRGEKRVFFSKVQRLSVSLVVTPPDKRKRDIDGILKILLDSLQRKLPFNPGIYEDDYQIKRLLVEMLSPAKDKVGLVEVFIEEYT